MSPSGPRRVPSATASDPSLWHAHPMARPCPAILLTALFLACSSPPDDPPVDDTDPEVPAGPWLDESLDWTPGDTPAELDAVFAEHGGEDAFGALAVDAVRTYLDVEERLRRDDSAGAREQLDALWDRYPVGGEAWGQASWQVNGAHFGYPPAYYGLRMLDDVIDRRQAGADAPASLHLTIVLVDCAEGIQATTLQELEDGGGAEVRLDLDERVLDTDAVFGQATWAFQQYVEAVTLGEASLRIRVARLEDVCVPIETTAGPPRRAAATSLAPVWEGMPDAITGDTDWWWVLYPSAVPEQHAAFDGMEFITGGMARHPGGGPVFLSDDRWVLRIPPHMGSGDWSDVERRTYFPQWLQHEFFHFLFAAYPEFGLEENSHQWFDRGTWPEDFEGRFEADYYAEALHRRLWSAEPPLAYSLRFRPAPDELYEDLTTDDVLGTYRREPVENDWHIGDPSLLMM